MEGITEGEGKMLVSGGRWNHEIVRGSLWLVAGREIGLPNIKSRPSGVDHTSGGQWRVVLTQCALFSSAVRA